MKSKKLLIIFSTLSILLGITILKISLFSDPEKATVKAFLKQLEKGNEIEAAKYKCSGGIYFKTVQNWKILGNETKAYYKNNNEAAQELFKYYPAFKENFESLEKSNYQYKNIDVRVISSNDEGQNITKDYTFSIWQTQNNLNFSQTFQQLISTIDEQNKLKEEKMETERFFIYSFENIEEIDQSYNRRKEEIDQLYDGKRAVTNFTSAVKPVGNIEQLKSLSQNYCIAYIEEKDYN